ncbi:MAG TPA: protein kinase [Ktedonobacteraceae bacterium]
MERIGKKLGNYEIQRLLGRGGFAEVYLGQHVFLRRPAAIKVMQAQFDAQTFARFQAEAQVIANLQHPHIVPVLEFGLAEEDRAPFLVMEYTSQGSLRQRYPKGSRIGLPTAVEYIKQVATALQYAHNNRVIHRDIKPENMLFGSNGQVLLSDFGIALVLQNSHYQNSRDIVGTIAYMSPEQLQGKVTFASDQYALGIMLYEWLAGEPPFQGGFAEVGSQHLHMPSPSLADKVQGLPRGVDQVIQKALAKDASQRFASVQDFATALEIAARGDDPTSIVQRSFDTSIAVPLTESGPSIITGLSGSQGQLSATMSPSTNAFPPPPSSRAQMPYPPSPSGAQTPYPPSPSGAYPPSPYSPASPPGAYPPYPSSSPSGAYPPYPPSSPLGAPQIYPAQIGTSAGNFPPGQFAPPPQPPLQPAKRKSGRVYQVAILLLLILVVGVGVWGYTRGLGNTHSATNNISQSPQATQNQSTQPTATTAAAQNNPTPTPATQVTPTATTAAQATPGANGTPLASDAALTENKLLTCSCTNDPIHFTINTITIDNANGRTIWAVTLKNVSGTSYNAYEDAITLQALPATNQPVSATGYSTPYLNSGDKATLSLIFAFVPYKGIQYSFSAHIHTGDNIDMNFNPVTFTF